MEKISAILPKRIIKVFEDELELAGFEINARKFLGMIMLVSIIVGAISSIAIEKLYSVPIIATLPLIAIITFFCFFAWLNIVSDNKGKFIEKILPDALQLIASNMKSGMTMEKSLFASAKEEFGPLAKELKLASKKAIAGERTEIIIIEMSKRIKSRIFERTMWLISKGATKGGEIADLLMQLSDDLRSQLSLQEESKANISMYVMLIFFGAAIGAPALLGISTYIVGVMEKQNSALLSQNFSQETTGMLKQSKVGISIQPTTIVGKEFVSMFATIIIIVGAFFASLTMGVINTGKELNGLKNFPVILLIGLGLFFATQIGLEKILAI